MAGSEVTMSVPSKGNAWSFPSCLCFSAPMTSTGLLCYEFLPNVLLPQAQTQRPSDCEPKPLKPESRKTFMLISSGFVTVMGSRLTQKAMELYTVLHGYIFKSPLQGVSFAFDVLGSNPLLSPISLIMSSFPVSDFWLLIVGVNI